MYTFSTFCALLNQFLQKTLYKRDLGPCKDNLRLVSRGGSVEWVDVRTASASVQIEVGDTRQDALFVRGHQQLRENHAEGGQPPLVCHLQLFTLKQFYHKMLLISLIFVCILP
jgi:hypothetical protein